MTSGLSRNYARALFELATETSSIREVEADLRAARDALYADREVRDFLATRWSAGHEEAAPDLAPSRGRWIPGC